jgi:trypsin
MRLGHRRHLRRWGLALLLLTAAALAAASPADAIVGGAVAPPGRWPWMVALLDSSEPDAGMAQYCGGVVIGAHRVLTAGHCVLDRASDEIDVLVGRLRLSEPQGRRLPVESISVFPGFVDGRQPGLDAAVLTVRANLGVPPLALARPEQAAAWAADAPAWTTGWGRLNARRSPGGSFYWADQLRELGLSVQGDAACENAYGLGWPDFPYRPSWLLCAGTAAGTSGPCFGDSGGPLVVGAPGAWLDVGILSGGDACATPGYPDLYARVDRVSRFALAASPAVQPDPLALPRVTGHASAGARMRCTHGRWRGRPSRFDVAWTRRGSSKVLARGTTYRPTRRDARAGVECAVTASSRGGRVTVTAVPPGAKARPMPRRGPAGSDKAGRTRVG